MEPSKPIVNTDTNSVNRGQAVAHRDGLGRVSQRPKSTKSSLSATGLTTENAYLRPEDGRLAYFRVQRKLVSRIPLAIKMLEWIFSSTSAADKARGDGEHHISADKQTLLRWIPGSLAILFLMCIPTSFEGEIRNGGYYDPVRYREWLYAKVPRNAAETPSFDDTSIEDDYENTNLLQARPDDIELGPNSYPRFGLSSRRPKPAADIHGDAELGMLTREQGPKFLCFVEEPTKVNPGYQCRRVHDWMHDNGVATEPKFVFLSYTRKQFCVATATEMNKWRLSKEEREFMGQMSVQDRQALLQYGCQIARAAGVPAFWVDFECLRPDSNSPPLEDDLHLTDVYRICDIVRVSSQMVIIRGPPIDARDSPSTPENKSDWLLQWGSRLWTVPEALLCPSEVIDIYTRGEGMGIERIEKRRLAASAWSDAEQMRDLIDHYMSSLQLTPLELVSIAFKGLQWRRTDQMTPGDTSYALMGLLRRRPLVVRGDSDFEAFARLSLANDSDMLLERLLCMQPPTYQSPWHNIEDAWHAHLWDIQPHCQVAGIVDNRTITLDGAFAATIHWETLEPVAFIKRNKGLRNLAKVLVRAIPGYVLFGLLMLAIGAGVSSALASAERESGMKSPPNGIEIVGIVTFVLSLCLSFLSPLLLYILYRGKFWSTQAWFFGMEGIPDLDEVEKCLFGLSCGRLKWSPFGSLLSRHGLRNGECVGLKPYVQREDVNATGMKIYTIVDTFTMTATSFYAAQPPSTVMICGKEGGMQRAVLCSYDWETQTFCREAVLRMKTLVLERMSRIDRFRFCLDQASRLKSVSQERL